MANFPLCHCCTSSKIRVAIFLVLNVYFGATIFLIAISPFMAPLVFEIDGKQITVNEKQAISPEDCENGDLLAVKLWLFIQYFKVSVIFQVLFLVFKVNIVLASNLSFSSYLLLTESPYYGRNEGVFDANSQDPENNVHSSMRAKCFVFTIYIRIERFVWWRCFIISRIKT